MECKFTSDGRKVVIVGALNAKETIVQEIFVNNGTEFPAGEHFVVKTLLDVPAKTYKAEEERRVLENIKRLEGKRDRLELEIRDFTFKSQAAAAKIKWINGITETELQEVFDNLKAIICGEYTYVVIPGFDGIEIKEWDHKLFTNSDGYGQYNFDSLRLISLFGDWNGRLNLNWKVNTYRDGSGSSTQFYPCKSLQEAIEKAGEIIKSEEHLSDKDYEFCIKYGISVDEVKNAARLEGKAEYIKKQIADKKKQLEDLEISLGELK